MGGPLGGASTPDGGPYVPSGEGINTWILYSFEGGFGPVSGAEFTNTLHICLLDKKCPKVPVCSVRRGQTFTSEARMKLQTAEGIIVVEPEHGSIKMQYRDQSASVTLYLNEEDYAPLIKALQEMHKVCYE